SCRPSGEIGSPVLNPGGDVSVRTPQSSVIERPIELATKHWHHSRAFTGQNRFGMSRKNALFQREAQTRKASATCTWSCCDGTSARKSAEQKHDPGDRCVRFPTIVRYIHRPR